MGLEARPTMPEPAGAAGCPGLIRVRRFAAVSQDINVLALVKGSERYVFLYDDASRAETLRVWDGSLPTRN